MCMHVCSRELFEIIICTMERERTLKAHVHVMALLVEN